jgi:hypothetical protein
VSSGRGLVASITSHGSQVVPIAHSAQVPSNCHGKSLWRVNVCKFKETRIPFITSVCGDGGGGASVISKPRVILLSREHVAISADMLGYHDWL